MAESKSNIASLVSYRIFPPVMGGQRGIALFNKYFSHYVNLVCITVKSNDPRLAEGYEVLNILSDSPWRYINLFHFFKLRSIIRKRNISHLQLEHPYLGWLGVLLKSFCGIKLIVHSHNIEGLRWKTLGKWWWKIMWYYEKWVHRRANFNFFKQDADMGYGIRQFGLKPERCSIVTYGIEWDHAPSMEERIAAREQLRKQYGIPADHHILLFNGAFNYPPNLNGLKKILYEINPILDNHINFHYSIIICGKDIPSEIAQQKFPNMILAGFVKDIDIYFKGSDTFLNPITEGGGIKTKLVEALGWGMNAVSSQSGAIGVDPSLCNGKLIIAADKEWMNFALAIVQIAGNDNPVLQEYFDHFYWGNIAGKAFKFIGGNNP